MKLGGDRGNLPEVAEKGRLVGLTTRRREAEQRTADLAPIIAELRSEGATSLRKIADGLNVRGVPAARGGRWTAVQVQRLGL